jgi:putative phage-type endonuclease
MEGVMNLLNPMTDEDIEKMRKEIELDENTAEECYKKMDDAIKYDLHEFCLEMFNNLHLDCIHLTCEENFDEFMRNNVTSMLTVHCETVEPYQSIIDNIPSNIKEIIIEYIVNYGEKMFYTHIAPRRSYDKTFIRFMPDVEKLNMKIEHVRNKPQPEQRTDEWYETRYNMITASSVGKIFETQSSINSIIYEKCKPLTVTNQSTGGALGWGIKYEPVSVMFYEKYYNCKVEDFGCVQHDKYNFIGASPDGIVVCEKSSRHGRMLEIKNPISRTITGNPKKMYWIQMQYQMEVCNLNECDFLETKFVEYANEEDFKNDGTFNSTTIGQLKGIILHFTVGEGSCHEYLPIYSSEEEYIEFKKNMIEKYGEENFIKIIYYKLDHYSCILVLRNKEWINQSIPKVSEVWSTILKERDEGYGHRAPKERKKKACLVDMQDMNEETINDTKSQDTVSNMFKSPETSQNILLKVRTESFDETINKMDKTIQDMN